MEKQFIDFLGSSREDRMRCLFETRQGEVIDIQVVQYETMNSKKNKDIQRHMDRWADLMQRIVKNPEIADRIPNNANLFFLNDEVVLINGEPRYYRELVKIQRGKKKTAKGKKRMAKAVR